MSASAWVTRNDSEDFPYTLTLRQHGVSTHLDDYADLVTAMAAAIGFVNDGDAGVIVTDDKVAAELRDVIKEGE